MKPSEVAELAHREGEMWEAGRTAGSPRPLPSRSGAYVPLTSAPQGPDERFTTEPVAARPTLEFVSIVASGTRLIFAFTWPEDAAGRTLLLIVDFANAGDDLTGAGTWLLEYVEQHIHHDTSWFPDRLTAISEGLAVVETVRQP